MKKGENVSAFQLAGIYSELGERDEAFKWLEKAFQNKEIDLVYLKVSPYGTSCAMIRDLQI